MPNLKISQLPAAGALTGAELLEAVQGGVNVQTTSQDIADLGGGGGGTTIPYGETSGTNTYTATTTPTTSSYTTAGALWHIKIKSSSSSASTLNIDGVGAKKIMMRPTTQASTGDLIDEQSYILAYDAALDSGNGAFLVTGSDPQIPSAGLIGNLLYLYNNFV